MATDSNRITGSSAERSVLVLASRGPGSPENAPAWRLRQILETLLEDGSISVDLVLDTAGLPAKDGRLLEACRSVVFRPRPSGDSIWEQLRARLSRLWSAVRSGKRRVFPGDGSYAAVLGLGLDVLPWFRVPAATRVLDLTDLGPFYPDAESPGFASGEYLGERGRRALQSQLRGVDCVTLPCERDAALWRSLGMGERVAVVPYRPSLEPAPTGETLDCRRPRVLIPADQGAGGSDGVRFVRRRIVPRVRTWIPRAQFVVSGGGARIDPGAGFEVARASFRDLLPGADVVVLPFRAGRRVRPTVIETLGAGKPLVATRAATYGLKLESGVEALIVEEPWQLADALIAFLTEAPVREALSSGPCAGLAPEAMKSSLECALGLVARPVRSGPRQGAGAAISIC